MPTTDIKDNTESNLAKSHEVDSIKKQLSSDFGIPIECFNKSSIDSSSNNELRDFAFADKLEKYCVSR